MKLSQYLKYSIKHSPGFTLVEILIAISIMAILFGAGYANYRSFSRRTALLNAVKNIQADLRYTQATALSGELPVDANCNGTNNLNGYMFTILSASNYEVRANCTGGSVASAKKNVVLPAGITITTTPFSILFKVLGSGTDISTANVTINLLQAGTGSTGTVTVSAGGQIE